MGLFSGLHQSFLNHFDAWIRLEPRSRVNDFDEGVAARTADPLWMLARQWQMGEFKAENAGSPLQVELTYSTQAVDSLKTGDNGQPVPINDIPTEILVERESFTMSWKERVRIGQEFERRARAKLQGRAQALIDSYRDTYGLRPPPAQQWLETDRATQKFIRFMTDRVIDGKRLFDAHVSGGLIPPPNGISAAERDELFDQMSSWRKALKSEPTVDATEDAWIPDDLAYHFELNPPSDGALDKTHLGTDSYRKGEFDWFSVVGKSDPRGTWEESPDPIKAYATRISVGNTSPRWWAFEDAKTDLGDLDVGKPDLAKLLLMEFIFAHGDDWFSVPLPIKTGNLVQVNSLKVFNIFDDEPIEIQSARQLDNDPLKRWEIFTISGEGEYDEPGIGDCLYVPRVAAYREESPPLEEVRFLRDEGANMVWGVEHSIANGLGKPVRGFEAHLERQDVFGLGKTIKWLEEYIKNEIDSGGLTDEDIGAKEADLATLQKKLSKIKQSTPSPSSQSNLIYRLASPVPENWIPFVPAEISLEDERSRMRLNRAQMLRNSEDEDPTPIPALSRLLGTWEDPLLWLEEYTVTRFGVRVLLNKQRCRDVDGRTYVWLGKKVLTGRGEGSSGLKFDVLRK